MTTHVVGASPPALPLTRNGSAGANSRATSTALPFGHQLHAARQQQGEGVHDAGATDAARPRPGAVHGSERPHDQTSMARDAHRPDDGSARPKMRYMETTPASAPICLPADRAPNAADVVMVAAPAADILAGAAGSDLATGEKSDDEGDLAASALVGAMFAMLDPAAARVSFANVPASRGAPLDPAGLVAGGDAGGETGTLVAADGLASSALAATVLDLPLSGKAARHLADADAAVATGVTLPVAASPQAPLVVTTTSPVGSHAFSQELGQQVAWFVSHDVKQARIRLHPEELGSLDLKVSVNHGRVDVVFHAQHPGAVNAVQQSLPQLEHMLAQHGLSLGHAEVGQHGRGDPSGQAAQESAAPDGVEGPAQAVIALTPMGLLDAFA